MINYVIINHPWYNWGLAVQNCIVLWQNSSPKRSATPGLTTALTGLDRHCLLQIIRLVHYFMNGSASISSHSPAYILIIMTVVAWIHNRYSIIKLFSNQGGRGGPEAL